MTLGQVTGLLIMFTLAMVPASLFVGMLLLKRRPSWLRWSTSVLAAAGLAYGIVFHQPAVLGKRENPKKIVRNSLSLSHPTFPCHGPRGISS